MTGECKNCHERLRGNSRKANLKKYDGVVEYCSIECLYNDIGKDMKHSKFSDDEENKMPWE